MTQNVLDATVKIGTGDSATLAPTDVFDLQIESDLDHPDMAAVTLTNQTKNWSETVNLGDPFEISAGFAEQGGAQAAVIFKGEVSGIEPIFVPGGGTRVVIRGLNLLHKLYRGKVSLSYTNVTDKDIANKIAGKHGLSLEYDGPSGPKYDHVYQHNQNDLEFLRMRAARIGCEVLVDDKKLYFRKRSTSDSGVAFDLAKPGKEILESFMPRLSTANQVSKVKVRGWDPKKKEAILGEATPQSSALGDKHGTQVTEGTHKNVEHYMVDIPVQTKEEADNIAKAILDERLMSFITADGIAKGSPNLKPGIVATFNVGCKRFSGKYYIVAVRHRYRHEGPDRGFRTHFKCRRDAMSNS